MCCFRSWQPRKKETAKDAKRSVVRVYDHHRRRALIETNRVLQFANNVTSESLALSAGVRATLELSVHKGDLPASQVVESSFGGNHAECTVL